MNIPIKSKAQRNNRWLKRQLNDPYVHKAHYEGYRSRAAFKLLEIDKKFNLIKNTNKILDLGCAPGSWLQVLSKYSNRVIYGIDLIQIDPINDVSFIQGDFTDPKTQEFIKDTQFDLILSDMAPNTIGHQQTDHFRIMGLLTEVVACADQNLIPNGNLVMKIFQGSEFQTFIQILNKKFHKVHLFKPESSRKESAETYIICLNKEP